MKLIDEKGKLFGKINVIDLLIILLILAVVAIGGYKMAKGGVGVSDKKVTATVVFKGTKITDEVADKNLLSYALVTGPNQFNGKIIDAQKVPTEVYDKETGMTIESGYNDFYVTAEVTLSDRANTYKLGSTELRVGDEYELKTKDFYMKSEVQSIELAEVDEVE